MELEQSGLRPELASLLILAQIRGVSVTRAELAHLAAPEQEAGEALLSRVAAKIGLRAKHIVAVGDKLPRLPMPAIARSSSGEYFVIAKAEADRVLVYFPGAPVPELLTKDQLKSRWDDSLVLFESCSVESKSANFGARWLAPYLLKYRGQLIEVLVASLFIQLFALALPIFFQTIFDKVISHNGINTLNLLTIGMVIILVFEWIMTLARNHVLSVLAARIDMRINQKVFEHVMALPFIYHWSRPQGTIVARIKEIENFRAFLTHDVLNLLVDGLFIVLFLAVMFYYSVELSLLLLVTLPVLVLVSTGLRQLYKSQEEASLSRASETNLYISDTLAGVDTIKAMSIEKRAGRELADRCARDRNALVSYQALQTLQNETQSLLSKFITVAILWMASGLVLDGSLTMGQMIAFNMLASRVIYPVIRLSQTFDKYQRAMIAKQIASDIIDTPDEESLSGGKHVLAMQGSISFRKVSLSLGSHTRRPVLSEASFHVKHGQVAVFVGSSGSGKTILAKLLQRAYTATTGQVLIDSVNINEYSASVLRKQLLLVQNNEHIFNRSVRENLTLSNPTVEVEAIIRVCRLVGAHELISELADGYETVFSDHGAHLSAGERQRLILARAILANPKILVIDDATNALDADLELELLNNIRKLRPHATLIVMSSRSNLLQIADKAYRISAGAIVELRPSVLPDPAAERSSVEAI